MSETNEPDRPRSEEALLTDRRREIDPGAVGDGQRLALSISGGGIRSATFALGVLEALARMKVPAAPVVSSPSPPPPPPPPGGPAPAVPGSAFRTSFLSRFDYLSTVSGGGYVGAFLCSLFQPDRLRPLSEETAPAPAAAPQPPDGQPASMFARMSAAMSDHRPERRFTAEHAAQAADDAVRVLQSGPPGRIRSETDYDQGDEILRAPKAWLRENGRYLIPTGTGDAFYAAALSVRNWVAVHYVIGMVLITLLAAIGAARIGLALLWNPAMDWEFEALTTAIASANPDGSLIGSIWWSPLFPLALAPLLFAGLPLGIAFWLVSERLDGKSWPINRAVVGSFAVIGILVVLAFVAFQRTPLENFATPVPDPLPWHRQLILLGLAAEAALGFLAYLCVACRVPSAAIQRVQLTRGLSAVLVTVAVILGLAVIDTLGQTLYLLASRQERTGPVLVPTGLTAVLVWLAQRAAAKGGGLPDWFSKIPTHTLAGLAGILIFVLVGSLWSVVVNAIVWDARAPDIGPRFLDCSQLETLLYLMGLSAFFSAVTGQFAGFINLSSLQAFYGSRLTRAYLGASNGKRFKSGDKAARSASEPLPNDNLTPSDYYGLRPGGREKVLTTFAPLHLINVTVNKTVDPAEQLVQRDRKGQPMAVMPFGFQLDTHGLTPFPKQTWKNIGASGQMSIGHWIGTSGAAFSTGIGRETSLGMSLLMGAANVRLGTWWGSGLDQQRVRGIADGLRRAAGGLFRTQTYLSYEFRAQFFGTARAWQYLSDGGHFENTGMYELLRPGRRVLRIFATDSGADPDYHFEDLANLIRLVRIDFGVEVDVQLGFSGELGQVFAGPGSFKRMSPCDDSPVLTPRATPCALLLWATRRGETTPCTQIVVFKPTVPWDADEDVRQYAVEHASFPQEPTADQFFDEAQWESYRSLGQHLGGKIFDPVILRALDELMLERMGVVAPWALPAPPPAP